MGSCAAPSAKGDDKFITTDYLQQCLAVSVTLCLMPAWYSQVDSTGFRSSSLKTVPVFRTP
ncbi:hypothetical protein D9H87_25355 [Escherichia coli]|uniref:Uncharacterized protein n=1 Tax=Escherichia coli TaxID=562 RepID=A0A7U5Z181_ECOLX|nr:hypothetical protein C3F40_29320 [Escherichia coli]MHR51455.1 hypothetical protein [Escherichia coli]